MCEGTCLLKEAERRACVFELREHLGGAIGADQKVRFLAVGQKLVKRGLLLGTDKDGVAYALLRLRGGQQRTDEGLRSGWRPRPEPEWQGLRVGKELRRMGCGK